MRYSALPKQRTELPLSEVVTWLVSGRLRESCEWFADAATVEKACSALLKAAADEVVTVRAKASTCQLESEKLDPSFFRHNPLRILPAESAIDLDATRPFSEIEHWLQKAYDGVADGSHPLRQDGVTVSVEGLLNVAKAVSSKKQPSSSAIAEFQDWAVEMLGEIERAPTLEECWEWCQVHGVSREAMRAARVEWPSNLKRGRGKKLADK